MHPRCPPTKRNAQARLATTREDERLRCSSDRCYLTTSKGWCGKFFVKQEDFFEKFFASAIDQRKSGRQIATFFLVLPWITCKSCCILHKPVRFVNNFFVYGSKKYGKIFNATNSQTTSFLTSSNTIEERELSSASIQRSR